MTPLETDWLASEIRDIRVEDLTRFLARSGWRKTNHPNEKMVVFEGQRDDSGGSLRIVLAARNDYADSSRLIWQAVQLLARLNESQPQEIVRSLREFDRDVLRIRLRQAFGKGLPFDMASRFMQTIRDLLSYAACAEENPKPYFAKATGIGRQFAENCLFGHTFHGSFGFTVESPSVPAASQSDDADSPPFERRVMQRIYRGLSSIRDAVLSGSPEILIRDYERGFNANLCEVMLDATRQTADSQIEYSIAWSPEWPVAEDVRAPRPVRIELRAQQYLETAARELRKIRESAETKIGGKIVQLRSEGGALEEDDDESDGQERTITVVWDDPGRRLRIRVSLDPPDYAAACDAHKNGYQVEVRGRLEKIGKFWKLMAPREFRAIS